MRIAIFFFFATALALTPLVAAQQSSEQPAATDPTPETSQQQSADGREAAPDAPREDYYRAEFVILERVIDADAINERMASRMPAPPDPEITEILRAVDENGTAETTLDLVRAGDLHLRSAAERLENSGKYRVLLATGWYQSFPPDFEGEPLRVAIGDWLDGAGHRDVEGNITIDRQRYLHVDVKLNHWQPMPSQEPPVDDINASEQEAGQPSTEAGAAADEASDENTRAEQATDTAGTTLGALESSDQPGQALIAGVNWPRAELLTWIRENRRMRSEEVHFLDSPTIGVLVFFKKIEEEELPDRS